MLAGVFLGSHLQRLVSLELGPGDTAFLPSGWLAAKAAEEATLAVGGIWMQCDATRAQLQAWSIEVRPIVTRRDCVPLISSVDIVSVRSATTGAGVCATGGLLLPLSAGKDGLTLRRNHQNSSSCAIAACYGCMEALRFDFKVSHSESALV